ncbi:MAG: hypothetical protein IJJ41_03750 [Clostridia bacterium]|nr:hypothetical protein [Clostridia bacterium]
MPNYLCKQCNCINQVAPEATHFTCKNCGVKQETPSFLESVDSDALDEAMLGNPVDEGQEKPFIETKLNVPNQPQKADFNEVKPEDAAGKDSIYFKAVSKMGGANIVLLDEALTLLQTIRGWKDAEALIEQCEEKIERLLEEERLEKEAEQKRQKSRKRAVVIGVSLFVFLVVFATVFGLKIYPDIRYHKAVAFAESGDTVKAYELFKDLGDYKDSSDRAAALYETYKTEKLTSAFAGDTVYFGNYEQDGNTKNGKEAIAWVVLEKAGDKLLLCSLYGLDYQKYSEEKEDTTWETSNMRQWLNTDFAEEAFTKEEMAFIATTEVPTGDNEHYNSTPYGNETKDKLFLLSLSEVKKYFPTAEKRLASPTDYAVKQGVYQSNKRLSGNFTCCWLLRTPGSDGTQVAYVNYDGELHYSGASVNTRGATFRPTMWIEIQKEQ